MTAAECESWINDYRVRDQASFNHAQEIAKTSGVLDHILEWCKLELTSDWRWQLVQVSTASKPGRYIFYFDEERDYFAFVIKWL